ncbi:MauE/DoxX family redox-associated membrane protein [Psychroflexus montanilacus]|uniref:MauE/DoxX family redox-associated membrane protein n=1 Tax=Psychroflexus montanilacus TaxID=2873598 RepID=UPI001CCBEA00|nr:MauE/DoxX family redox-associated membrane protein [Psychroflexus montanilacus]MBZ9650870.1 hypothetical protein [Psychroflexus montanilacus]
MKYKGYIYQFIRFAFIVLMFYAAIHKLMDFTQFYNDLLNSPVFGNKHLARFVSAFVPIIELGIAGLLISAKYKEFAMYLASGLMLIFSIYIIWIMEFSADVPCSCGGIINNLTWQEHLLFNTGFLLLGILGIYIQTKKHRKFYKE